MSLINVKGVGKTIKGRPILQDINFSIEAGECIALIGPNGAGKTTLIELLLHDKILSQGTITIKGMAVGNHKLKSTIGLLPQTNELPKNLKVKELISFFQAIYDYPLTQEEIQEILRFSPSQYNQMTQSLSGGQRRLLGFALTLIGRPSVLILDEPTAAMDTSTRQQFWEIIRRIKETGTTILYSSHYIEEVEHTAERILVLHQGKLIRDTTPHRMRSEELTQFFTVPLRFQEVLFKRQDIMELTESSDSLTFHTKNGAEVWAALSQAGCDFSELEVARRTLLNSIFETTRDDQESEVK